MEQLSKNQRIKESLAATREKRKGQECKVVTGKIQHLNTKQSTAIAMQFIEAKWLVNEMLNFGESNKIYEYKPSKQVIHKDRDGNDVISDYQFLGSQMKQALVAELLSNIKTLASLKKKGKKVGKIKFKKRVTSINLKQYGVTYRIVDRNHIRIQGIKGNIRIHGLDGLFNKHGKVKKHVDIANAKLIVNASGYYLAVTYFVPKEFKAPKTKKLGIDLGCSTTLTTSDGRKLNISVEETDRIKRLQRKLTRQQKGSNNRYKTKQLLKKEYIKLNNKKENAANQIVAGLMKEYEIYLQDEQLINWQKTGHGKAISHSILGRLKSKFISKGAKVVGKWVATTRTCACCGHKNPKQELWVRTFVCEDCGFSIDRDVNAANNMILMYNELVGVERTELTPVESKATAISFDSKSSSEKQEGEKRESLEDKQNLSEAVSPKDQSAKHSAL